MDDGHGPDGDAFDGAMEFIADPGRDAVRGTLNAHGEPLTAGERDCVRFGVSQDTSDGRAAAEGRALLVRVCVERVVSTTASAHTV